MKEIISKYEKKLTQDSKLQANNHYVEAALLGLLLRFVDYNKDEG